MNLACCTFNLQFLRHRQTFSNTKWSTSGTVRSQFKCAELKFETTTKNFHFNTWNCHCHPPLPENFFQKIRNSQKMETASVISEAPKQLHSWLECLQGINWGIWTPLETLFVPSAASLKTQLHDSLTWDWKQTPTDVSTQNMKNTQA